MKGARFLFVHEQARGLADLRNPDSNGEGGVFEGENRFRRGKEVEEAVDGEGEALKGVLGRACIRIERCRMKE
jgi:hypothetical protein